MYSTNTRVKYMLPTLVPYVIITNVPINKQTWPSVANIFNILMHEWLPRILTGQSATIASNTDL